MHQTIIRQKITCVAAGMAAAALLSAGSVLAEAADPMEGMVPQPQGGPTAHVGAIMVEPPAPVPPYLPFPTLPAVQLDEVNNRIGVAQQTARENNLQARIFWIDATANLNRMNTPEKIEALVKRIAQAGFNVIVLEVKPIVGHTIYPSRYAPKLTEWVKGNEVRTLPEDFDPVPHFVKHAKASGLQLIANMNTFSEGHRDFQMGPGYNHPEWQTVLYEAEMSIRPNRPTARTFPLMDRANQPSTGPDKLAVYSDLSRYTPKEGDVAVLAEPGGRVLAMLSGMDIPAMGLRLPPNTGLIVGTGAGAEYLRRNVSPGEPMVFQITTMYVPISERPRQQIPLMVNPNSPEVRRRITDMVVEVVRNYDVDGVIFDDRLRYAGIHADFSEKTREQFEQYVGKKLNWPDDVFRWEVQFPTMERRAIPGPQFDNWQLFRALTLRNWLANTIQTVKAIRPNLTVSAYVGSWYGEYPIFASNWAADDLEAGFRFLTPAYQKTGFAGLLDWITTGCYYRDPTIAQAIVRTGKPGASVEGGGQLSNRVVNDQTWVYAGLMLMDYFGRTEEFKTALQAAAATTQGIMIFDLSHNIEQFWPIFDEAFKKPARAPHTVPGLIDRVRERRREMNEQGIRFPPVIVNEGIPGTGF